MREATDQDLQKAYDTLAGLIAQDCENGDQKRAEVFSLAAYHLAGIIHRRSAALVERMEKITSNLNQARGKSC